jgi:DNA polymerase-1
METSTDYKGMRHGLEVFRHVNDTMLYCYLALNSTADIKLGLKPNSFEYTGNYALDDEKIHDVQSMDSDLLLKYNLTDCLATWFVKEKYEPKVIADDQMDTYTFIMQPSLVPLLEMMLVGLPLDLSKVTSAKIKLEAVRDIATRIVKASPVIKKTQFALQMKAMREANASLKKKVKSLDEFKDLLFNPGSPLQLSYLLYDVLKLPVVDFTKTKQPATGQKTLKKLVAHTNDEKTIELLEALIELAQSSKILNDFIANFQLLHFRRDDETTWLNGDQVLGGTQSGRLSARNPNLANLPSNSIYGKTIKSCFVAKDGWLFGGADFSALEDKIGAILSGDEMKTAEFTKGMDGHSARAIAFFSKLEEPVTIKNTFIDPKVVQEYDINSVEDVNRFKKEHEDIRQEAKAPSFALQYLGTWATLVNNIGLPKPVAQAIEIGYHALYFGLAKFAEANKKFAAKHGYVQCAFGLRLRTPLLAQTILGNSFTPREAEKEARSSNNAITQSWGLLSNRAAIEIHNRIIASEYAEDIYIINQIHDAIYFTWRDDVNVTKWLNDNLIECMEWQDDPMIASDDVKLGAELDVGLSWDKQYTLKNKATLDEIQEFMKQIKE